MAETLISPGVLARENDQSLVTAQPLTRGAAIIGPTVKGPVEKPTYVSSFSSFQAIFGAALESGSTDYTYLTSVSANTYFSSGGTSLLVTRVTSGSFSPALSNTVENNVETGDGGLNGSLLAQQVVNSGTGSVAAGTFVGVVVAGSISGTGATATVVTSKAAGNLITGSSGTNALSGGATLGNTVGPFVIAATSVLPTGGTGATFAVTGDGAGALASVTIVAVGSGYKAGDVVTISEADLLTAGFTANDQTLKITLAATNVLTKVLSVNVVEDGSGFVAGETATILGAAIGAGDMTSATFLLVASNIENANTFILETLSEGIIMNNTFPVGSDTNSTELARGALASGSADNIRWEIANVNTASGVFSLLIRRGNDNANQRVVLESYNNISLDPFSPNYISRAIGDVTSNVVVAADGSGTYLQESGSYPNISNYVRVKEVKFNTPRYFNNNGIAKTEFTASLPVVGSGSFDVAVGSNLNAEGANLFNEKISATNTQGLVGTDYTNAINLLANQDDFQYNVISAPGLYFSNYATQCNLIKNNTIARGDAIFIMDLVPYDTAINTVLQQAASLDSSYAAAYWPWLQTVDPNTGLLVYVPASTMIPGV